MNFLKARVGMGRVTRYVAAGVTAAALAGVTVAVVAGGVACKHTVANRTQLSSDEIRTATSFPYEAYDRMLHEYVDGQGNGTVDYVALRRNRGELDRILAFVAQAGPTTRPELYPTENHRKAFYVAAYNATVWRNVIDRPAIQNIDDNKISFFYTTRFVIDGHETNLLDLETDRVRHVFHDPRLHFALNCASGGCPRLPNEAFVPDRIEAQLEREAHRFCNETRNVELSAADHKVTLSHIFDWYAGDFSEYEQAHGHADGDRITFINRYRDANAQVPRDYRVEFRDYDWTINAQHAPGQPPSS
jgi:hypothetical protein